MNKEDKTTIFIKKILNMLNIKISNKTEKLFIQIFKFCIVGGIATIIDWAVYYVVYNFINVDPLIANILSFSISVVYNYIASIKWVFDVNNNKSKNRMFLEFMIFSIIGLIFTELLLWIFIENLKLSAMTSKIIATLVVMIFNFITRKIFLE